MTIEIDQSGKLEKTNIPTYIAFSNGVSDSICFSHNEKLIIKKHFRSTGKRRVYIYQTFAICIFLLLRDVKDIDTIIIDTEYPGQEPLIKNYLLQLFRSEVKMCNINNQDIVFKQIGKKSNAHSIAYFASKQRIISKKIYSTDILDKLKLIK